jgi:hypothetical protein
LFLNSHNKTVKFRIGLIEIYKVLNDRQYDKTIISDYNNIYQVAFY